MARIRSKFLCQLLPAWIALATLQGQTDRLWIGGSGSAWETPENWDPAGIPQTNDGVAFIRGPTTSTLNQTYVLDSFRVETNLHRLELNGHALEIANTFSLFTNLQGVGTNRWIVDGNGGLLLVGSPSNPAPLIRAGCKEKYPEESSRGYVAEMLFSNVTTRIYADEFVLGYNTNRDLNPVVTWVGSTLTVFQINRFFLGENVGVTAELAAVSGGRIQIGSPEAKCDLFLGHKRYREPFVWGVIRATNWSLVGHFRNATLGCGNQLNYPNGYGFVELDGDDEFYADSLFVGGFTNISGFGVFLLQDGSALRLGQNLSDRGNLYVAYSTNANYGSSSGRLEIANGVFQAFLTNLLVGYSARGGSQYGYLRLGPTNQIYAHNLFVGHGWGYSGRTFGQLDAVADGKVFLGSASEPVGLMAIGFASGDGHGTGKVSALTWKLNAHLSTLLVGRCVWTGKGAGFLELNEDDVINVSTMRVATRTMGSAEGGILFQGGVIRVSEVVEIGATGWITNLVPGYSSGLDLTGNTLTINGFYHMQFTPPTRQGIYWGLRWSGNRTNALSTLVNNGKITWDDSALPPEQQAALGIHYDAQENFSYIGFRYAKAGALILIR